MVRAEPPKYLTQSGRPTQGEVQKHHRRQSEREKEHGFVEMENGFVFREVGFSKGKVKTIFSFAVDFFPRRVHFKSYCPMSFFPTQVIFLVFSSFFLIIFFRSNISLREKEKVIYSDVEIMKQTCESTVK